MLDGEPVRLAGDAVWPLPPLPPNVASAATPDADCGSGILVTDEADRPPPCTVQRSGIVLATAVAGRRRRLRAGASPAEEVLALVDAALADAGLVRRVGARLATVDLKADEPGILEAAADRGWPLVTYPAELLAAVAVPNPSEVVRAAVGTPSVAEAAALSRPDSTAAPPSWWSRSASRRWPPSRSPGTRRAAGWRSSASAPARATC